MLPAQQVGNQQSTETKNSATVQTADVSAEGDYDPLAAFSLLIAIVALITAGLTYRRGSRIERQARFESSYGSQLRGQLRDLERAINNLTAFVVYSGRPIDTLLAELEETRANIELLCFDINCLLREIDGGMIGGNDWLKPFSDKVLQAERSLDLASQNSAIQFKVISGHCRKARESYELAIEQTRAKLRALEGKI